MSEIAAGYRLSPQQRRLWRLGRTEGSAMPWRAVLAVRLEGELATGDLRAALGRVAARHEILRTRLVLQPEWSEPVQVIGGAAAAVVEEQDWSALGAAAVERAAELFRTVLERGVDPLDEAPLRLVVSRLAANRHHLLLDASAFVLDGAGVVNLLRELLAELGGGTVVAEDDETLQYADVAEWLNELLSSEDGDAERDAWRRRGCGETLTLPWPVPAAQELFRPRLAAVPLNDGVSKGIETLARRNDVGLEACLLVAWRRLLERHLDGTGLTLGVLADGRHYEGLPEALGAFEKTVPVACSGAGDSSHQARAASAALEEARGGQEYFDWQDLAEKGARRPPAAEYALAFFEDPPPMTVGGLTASVEEVASRGDRSTLRLVYRQRASGPHRAAIEYDASRVGELEARRLARSLGSLLESLASGEPGRLERFSGLDAAERHRLAIEVPRPPSVATGPSLLERFEGWAARTPDRPAVHCGDVEWSYGELDRRASALARRLHRRGAAPERVVAVVLEPSPEALMAFLAIWKTGAAYLPLDPAQPPARLRTMLTEAGADLVVTGEDLRSTVSTEGGLEFVPLESAEKDETSPGPGGADEGSQGFQPLARRPENLAYVLFTSGSTGRPKGVAVEERQVRAYVDGLTARLGDASTGENWATVTTFAADLGLTMIYPALTTGGCLHVLDRESATRPETFAGYCEQHAIDHLKIVPSHLAALLPESDSGSAEHPVQRPLPRRPLPRRRLILGGEPFTRELAGRLRELAPDLEIHNHYGPTETTVGVLTQRLEAEIARHGQAGNVPLGFPLPGTRVQLLDRDLRPVPVWTPGQILIGGTTVTRGYLGRPAATAERFVPDPFARDPSMTGQRLYQTGDRARRRPDGRLEFLGRVDSQVKIRGYRVEPGEIEAVLRRHPAVRETAVVVASKTAEKDGTAGEPRLVAWVVARDPAAEPGTGELRAFAAEHLPEPMVPSLIGLLPRLPLTKNGKLDRHRLPDPETLERRAEVDHVAPSSELERHLVEIWQEVLGIEKIGTHHNFFDLGGHSLLLIKVAGRLRPHVGRDVSMMEMFKHPTVAALAAHLESGGGSGDAGKTAAVEEKAEERASTRRRAMARQRQRRNAGRRRG